VTVETGIWRDNATKELLSTTKVLISGKHEKIRRPWPAGKDSLRAARLWREALKTQHKLKHPTMTLRTNGTWVVNLPATPKYQPKLRDFGYQFSEALEWSTATYDRRRKGTWTDESTTVGDIWTGYLASPKRPKRATLIEYTRIWEHDLAPYWGGIVAADVGAKTVQKWINSWTSTVPKLRHAKSVISVVLSYAVDEEVLTHNPSFRRNLPSHAKPTAPAFTDDQLNVLVNHPVRYSDRLGLALGLQTALRISEWLALRVKDVNVSKNQVTVREHLTRVSAGKRELEAGHKTGYGAKTAGISRELTEAILVMARDYGLGPDDLLFPAPKGGIWDYNNFRDRVWEPARKAAGIEHVPYMTGTHSLKRTSVTVAFEGGHSAATIKGQTKHSGTKIILETYVQTSVDAEQQVAATIQKRLGLPKRSSESKKDAA
tara:strand:- start:174 stop:1466 length:1293 start_codon:yes stop_codon:yes gene_type:complete